MATDDKNTIAKGILAGILVALGLFSALVFLGNSWIKLAVIIAIIFSGLAWLVTHGLLKRSFKYLLLTIMIFTVAFAASERYVFWNAGEPPTFNPPQPGTTITYANILNASLTDIMESAKNTASYSLFAAEYPGEISFESIKLDTTFPGGSIEVQFTQKPSNLNLMFICSSGGSYHASVLPIRGSPLSQMFPQQQTPEDTLRQFDNRGLKWFYARAVEGCQNKTGAAPQVNALQASIQWDNYEEYRGMTLLVAGFYESNSSGRSVFFADFQPDGTLLYLNVGS